MDANMDGSQDPYRMKVGFRDEQMSSLDGYFPW